MGDKITPSRLLDKMFSVLQDETTTLECGRISNEKAFSEWDSEGLRIVVDPMQVGVIPAVVHELLHYCLEDLLDKHFNRELEEAEIDALEKVLYFRIEHFPTIYERWWNLITEKLTEGD